MIKNINFIDTFQKINIVVSSAYFETTVKDTEALRKIRNISKTITHKTFEKRL